MALGKDQVTPETDRGIASLKHHKNLIRRNTMDNFLSIFSRLWSDEKAQNRIGEDQIRIWAKTEYGRDWVHAYNYYLTNGQMPKENSRGLNNVQ